MQEEAACSPLRLAFDESDFTRVNSWRRSRRSPAGRHDPQFDCQVFPVAAVHSYDTRSLDATLPANNIGHGAVTTEPRLALAPDLSAVAQNISLRRRFVLQLDGEIIQ